MDLLDKIRNGFVFFEGGMGTLLQARGLKPGEFPELWNLEKPETIKSIHKDYLAAGAQICKTNTFGANVFKFDNCKEIVEAAVKIASEAVREHEESAYVALDIGPTGRMLRPLGDLHFEEAIEAFGQVVKWGAAAGADLILIETMNDIYEMKAAVLAAKENCDLPIFATAAFGEDEKMMTGADARTLVSTMESLGVSAVGLNCSFGPLQMRPIVRQLYEAASIPVIVNPNAGMPSFDKTGRAVYDIDPDQFADAMENIAADGGRILGGCCGTTPEYIRKLTERLGNKESSEQAGSFQQVGSSEQAGSSEQTGSLNKCGSIPLPLIQREETVISSYTHSVKIGDAPLLIGERINPTGKKKFKEALRSGDMNYILNEGIQQAESGVQILDVNTGLPEIDETKMLPEAIFELQSVTDLPLQIDTSDPVAMENALRIYNGKALINSVNGKQESMDAVFPLAAKYGGALIALTLDDAGIPETAEGRLEIARKIVEEAARYGIQRKDIIFDPLALAISADNSAAKVAVETIKLIKTELGCKTSLGISNISFGLPSRDAINSAFFNMAMCAGLDLAIMNPYSMEMMKAYRTYLALSGNDSNCTDYIAFAQEMERLEKENHHAACAGSTQGSGNKGSSSQCGASGENSQVSGSQTGGQVGAPGENNGASVREQYGSGTSGNDNSITDLRTASVLQKRIINGLKQQAYEIAKQMLGEGSDPLDVIDRQIIPALDYVGKGFEEKTVYLPQLLMSADAASCAFEAIKERINAAPRGSGSQESSIQGSGTKGPVILATVKGDIHDIGKNIVKVLLENYGFDVIDLGKDVAPEKIVDSALKNNAKIVGLSALMTTTVPSMAETIKQLAEADNSIKTIVGGAVLTQEYADMINADHYCKDAMATVRKAEELI